MSASAGMYMYKQFFNSYDSIIILQEIDELLGQNLTQEDEDAIAEELESILLVGKKLTNSCHQDGR